VDSDNKVFAREAVDLHVKECLTRFKSNFVVSLLTSTCPEPLPLIKGNSMCLPDKASIFLSIDGDGFVRGRCAVPKVYFKATRLKCICITLFYLNRQWCLIPSMLKPGWFR
jgi:hypothetical protein